MTYNSWVLMKCFVGLELEEGDPLAWIYPDSEMTFENLHDWTPCDWHLASRLEYLSQRSHHQPPLNCFEMSVVDSKTSLEGGREPLLLGVEEEVLWV